MKNIVIIFAFIICNICIISAQNISDEYFDIPKTKKIEKTSSHLKKGDIYYDQGDYQEAIQEYTLATNDYGVQTEVAYTKIGNTYLRLGEYENAMENYNIAIILNKDYAWAYRQLGFTYYLKNEYSKALENIEKAIELGSTRGWISQIMGICYFYNHEFQKAKDHFAEAIYLKADIKDETYYYYGSSYYYKKQYKYAIKQYEKCLKKTDGKIYNETIDIFNMLGRCYLHENKTKKATKYFNETIELFKEDNYLTAFAHYFLGNKNLAFNIINKAIIDAKNDKVSLVYYYYCLACLHSLNHDEQEALRNLELSFENGLTEFKFLKYDPDLEYLRSKYNLQRLTYKYKQ